MRSAPLLLILDEPTAALDPQAEARLFDRYVHAATTSAATTGGITVLVSHRFSTVRFADLIVVIDGGRIIETGTHEQLAAAGGLYAELYTLQAASYR
jgi:ATP-binding cassette subfamily B protein